MSQTVIVRDPNGRLVGVFNWPDGFRLTTRKTRQDLEQLVLWLIEHGREQEAEALMDEHF